MLRPSFYNALPLTRLKLSVRSESAYDIANVLYWRLVGALFAFCSVPCESDSPEISHEMAFLTSQSVFLSISETIDDHMAYDFFHQQRNSRKVVL
jgi:hypothetical protein